MKHKKPLLAGMGFLLLAASVSASAALITNGDFETGDLTGWTTFTTANGTIGTPAVTSFDVTGGGASNAGTFQVGRTSGFGGQEGGGIFQNFSSGDGTLNVTLDIASFNPASNNASGGVFSVFLDSLLQTSFDFGFILTNATERSSLAFSSTVAAGAHELRIQMTRPFVIGATPFQYVDNIVANVSPATSVPEPSELALFVLGVAAIRLTSRRATK